MIKFSSTIIFFILFIHPSAVNGQSREFEILKNIELIDQIHEYLELYFVDEPQTGKISKVAIDAMLKELDPYTVFYHESNMYFYFFLKKNYKIQNLYMNHYDINMNQ